MSSVFYVTKRGGAYIYYFCASEVQGGSFGWRERAQENAFGASP